MSTLKHNLGKASARLVAAFAVTMMLAVTPVKAEQAGAGQPELFLEDTSPAGFVATVNAFTEAVGDAGWSILGSTNMAGVLSERGYTVHPVLIFKPCSGAYSSELLGNDETRFVSSMIPCRVAIYKMSTGEVVISRINAVAMAGMIGGDAAPIIQQSGEELEQIIEAALAALGG